MNINEFALFEKIEKFCQEIEKEFDLISKERKEKLLSLRDYISGKIVENQIPKLIVICTHNSRRSHIGQIWLAVGSDYFQLPEIQTFSGGTEATAFNIRAVNAFQRIGFQMDIPEEKTGNPIYQISWKDGMKPYQTFSKRYEDEPNPKEKFGAIMVCSEADVACPFVPGCDFRLSLPYDDPKEFDETNLEEEKYGERVRQIGREILFMLSQVKEG
jgi:arsenate reductase